MDIVLIALVCAFLGAWLASWKKVKRLQQPVFVVFLHQAGGNVVDDKPVHVQQVLQFSGKDQGAALAAAREQLTRAGFCPMSGCFLKYECSNRAVWAEIIIGTDADNERAVAGALASVSPDGA